MSLRPRKTRSKSRCGPNVTEEQHVSLFMERTNFTKYLKDPERRFTSELTINPIEKPYSKFL